MDKQLVCIPGRYFNKDNDYCGSTMESYTTAYILAVLNSIKTVGYDDELDIEALNTTLLLHLL